MLSREQFKSFTEDVKKALAGVEKKYNLELELGNIAYDDFHFHTKLMATCSASNGENIEKLEFERCCLSFGLKPDDYGRKFLSQGSLFKLVGFNLKAKKYPIIGISREGTKYGFAQVVLKNLADN